MRNDIYSNELVKTVCLPGSRCLLVRSKGPERPKRKDPEDISPVHTGTQSFRSILFHSISLRSETDCGAIRGNETVVETD